MVFSKVLYKEIKLFLLKIGINSLSKMMSKKYIQILLGLSFLYLIPELLFKDAMLYIVGGSIGGIIYELFKSIGIKLPSILNFTIWTLITIGFIFLFFRVRNKLLKYIVLVLIGLLLYIVDIVLASIPVFNLENINFATIIDNVLLIFTIFVKALIMASMIYFGTFRSSINI